MTICVQMGSLQATHFFLELLGKYLKLLSLGEFGYWDLGLDELSLGKLCLGEVGLVRTEP